jgi:hypothetical protein
MMSPNTTIWWVPKSTVGFDPDAPSAALLTEALNISCAVVSGYTLNPTDSDTVDDATICNSANSSTPTFYNYEGNISFERESTGVDADDASARARAFDFFKHPDAEGYFVRRHGYRETVAAAAAQEVSVFYFISDNPQDVVADDGGPIQMTVPFLPQGKMVLNKALVA